MPRSLEVPLGPLAHLVDRSQKACPGPKLIVLAGQVSWDTIGEGDLAAQSEQCYLNIATALAEVGATFDIEPVRAAGHSKPPADIVRPVTGHEELPLLFLDVDGPLLPFGAGTRPGPPGPTEHLARLRPTVGLRLMALRCELVWATTWEDDANAEIAPRIGLPQLQVVTWPDPSDEQLREDQWFGLHWKTRTLVDWAAGRPFAWIDDEITESDRDWVASTYAGRALLHPVEASRGLEDEDFAVLAEWFRSI
ncbi:HAD domain-containing protein [Nocardia colli]|uniref:HAD domain-containing protein n=1 Tax=Nocardia colli TaxID=2545717 RepID=UPI0035D85EC2